MKKTKFTESQIVQRSGTASPANATTIARDLLPLLESGVAAVGGGRGSHFQYYLRSLT